MAKKNKEKVTKDMSFNEIIQKNPDSIGILMERGMHCIGCPMSAGETLEEGAYAHGIDPDLLISEINGEDSKKIIKKKKARKK